jgi:hypothetical protein
LTVSGALIGLVDVLPSVAFGATFHCEGGRLRSLEIPEALDSLLAECGRVLGDADLARPFDSGHAPVEGGNQLTKVTCELVRSYCHRRTAADASRRETFQISPQFWHRQ